MGITSFNPNRHSIKIGNRQFILDLDLREDGTGIARLSELDAEGQAHLLTTSFRNHPSHEWAFSHEYFSGVGTTPRGAAIACLIKCCGLETYD